MQTLALDLLWNNKRLYNDFNTILFPDDTTLQISGNCIDTLFDRANYNIKKSENWFTTNTLTINAKQINLSCTLPLRL